MTEPRQKSIGITPTEKAMLEKAKQRYDQHTGEDTDWGKFLGTAAILGLAALGVYKLIKSSKQNPTAKCAVCGQIFPIAFSGEVPSIAYIKCPNPSCGAELVVDFTKSEE